MLFYTVQVVGMRASRFVSNLCRLTSGKGGLLIYFKCIYCIIFPFKVNCFCLEIGPDGFKNRQHILSFLSRTPSFEKTNRKITLKMNNFLGSLRTRLYLKYCKAFATKPSSMQYDFKTKVKKIFRCRNRTRFHCLSKYLYELL